MATPLIPFTLAGLIGIWLASRAALPTLALGVATIVAVVGLISLAHAQAALDLRPHHRSEI
jgi:hypothetical protein